MVLIGEQSFRIFKFLSSASLVVGVLFLLLIPLSISSALRIEQQNNSQLSQKTTQIQQLKQELNAATTPTQITQVLTRLNPQAATAKIADPQAVKRQVLEKLAQAEQISKQQAAQQANNSFSLLKNAVKLVLGSLVSGTVFLIVWRKTLKVIKASTSRQ